MKTTLDDLVSVIITTHNRRDLIGRAVESVIGQTYRNLEIIIVDDNSTDDTKKCLDPYLTKNRNITYIKNKNTLGSCASRNIGIEAASGNYISGLDDDDFYLPKRIEELHAHYDREYSFVFSDYFIKSGRLKRYHYGRKILTLKELLFYNIVGNQVFTEKVKLDAVNGFNEQLSAAQDYDLWVRLIKRFGPALRVARPLLVMDVSSHNRITNSEKKVSGYRKFLQMHKNIMCKSHRAYLVYKIRVMKSVKTGLAEFLKYVPCNMMLREAKKMVSGWVRGRRSAP